MNDNVYQPMNVQSLRTTIRKHAPVFEVGKSSGFQVEDVDGEQATISWQNNGTDETVHRDQTERLSGILSRSGYEVKLTKPANVTLIVRKVEPVVIHNSAIPEGSVMGTFELMVESRYESLNETSTRLPANIRRKMNNVISDIATNARRDIPLDQIDAVLRKHGYLLVQEDGTPWSGLLTGREGRAKIELGIIGTEDEVGIHEVVSNALLILTWYKLGSGAWETVAYVS